MKNQENTSISYIFLHVIKFFWRYCVNYMRFKIINEICD